MAEGADSGFMNIYFGGFVASSALLAILTYLGPKDKAESAASNDKFKTFQNNFLLVYLLAAAGDWLQGPYTYRLYSYYGFSMSDNAQLFVAGFLSSAVFGTIAGGLVDRFGRKLGCIAFCAIYMASCATKHYNNFHVLMLGRVFGGIATSLYFSAFESWMVAAHNAQGFAGELISSTFSRFFVFNGIVAIVCGWVAQGATAAYNGHPVAPFDVAFILLGGCMAIVSTRWGENYGNSTQALGTSMSKAMQAVLQDRKVFLLGSLQSLFEGAMYSFVFLWTPALSAVSSDIPHGIIFAGFMVSSSVGGAAFKILLAQQPAEVLLRNVFLVASGSMVVSAFASSPLVLFSAFLVFEVCVGIFWPAMGSLRSRFIPDDTRATVMNIFRIPLNLMVCLILLYIGDLSMTAVFLFCAAFHFICFLGQSMFVAAIKQSETSTPAPDSK